MIDSYQKFTKELKELEVVKRKLDPEFTYDGTYLNISKGDGLEEMFFHKHISGTIKQEIIAIFLKYHPGAVLDETLRPSTF